MVPKRPLEGQEPPAPGAGVACSHLAAPPARLAVLVPEGQPRTPGAGCAHKGPAGPTALARPQAPRRGSGGGWRPRLGLGSPAGPVVAGKKGSGRGQWKRPGCWLRWAAGGRGRASGQRAGTQGATAPGLDPGGGGAVDLKARGHGSGARAAAAGAASAERPGSWGRGAGGRPEHAVGRALRPRPPEVCPAVSSPLPVKRKKSSHLESRRGARGGDPTEGLTDRRGRAARRPGRQVGGRARARPPEGPHSSLISGAESRSGQAWRPAAPAASPQTPSEPRRELLGSS